MARANGNCSREAPQFVFQVRVGDFFKTVRAVCWSAAVIRVCPSARPISWKEESDHILVNGHIEVKELRHIPLAWVRE